MLTREEELELARQLAEAAAALAEDDPELAERLALAAEAIERGDIAEAREAVREAAQWVGEAGERVQRHETIEATLAELQEGRERIAQASGPPPSSPYPPMGEGPGLGASPSSHVEGEGPGAGASQPSPPMGERSEVGVTGQNQPGHHEDAGTGAPYDRVYVPYRFDERGDAIDIGHEGMGDEGVPVGDVPLPAPEGGNASRPYREVYADYAAQANAALEGSYIPLGLKQYVRDYFSSLEP